MYLIIIILIFFDQIIKYLVIDNFYLGQSIQIIKNFFNITYVTNDGAAWNILSGNKIFFIILAISAVIFIIAYSKNKERYEKYAYAVLISGIIGNLLDRIFYGCVIDYLDFNIFGYKFPVFNLADICITLSAIVLLLIEVKQSGKNRSNN